MVVGGRLLNTDFRVRTGLSKNAKFKDLSRRLGGPGNAAWALLRLWDFTALYRPDGRLTDVDAHEIGLSDIEFKALVSARSAESNFGFVEPIEEPVENPVEISAVEASFPQGEMTRNRVISDGQIRPSDIDPHTKVSFDPVTGHFGRAKVTYRVHDWQCIQAQRETPAIDQKRKPSRERSNSTTSRMIRMALGESQSRPDSPLALNFGSDRPNRALRDSYSESSPEVRSSLLSREEPESERLQVEIKTENNHTMVKSPENSAADASDLQPGKREQLRKFDLWIETRFTWFWDRYPRREKRIESMRSFRKLHAVLCADGGSGITAAVLKTIAADIRKRIEKGLWDPNTPEGRSHIPHPSTYLNQQRWTDEV